MEANAALTKLAVEKKKVSASLGEKRLGKRTRVKPKEEEVTQPKLVQKLRVGFDNEWFGTDRVLTSAPWEFMKI
ncbi:MAG: hypothetical protein CM15mV124_250 [uncultured marine virus]|nr:MAG: hypothetical protein CM15mV124_250 [uncultured marine virus]